MKLSLPVMALAVASLVQMAFVLPVQASGSEQETTFEFSCVIWEPLSFSQLYYRQGGEFLPLDLTPGLRSSVNALKESSTLELHHKWQHPDGQSEYRLVGIAPRLNGSDRMLFLIEEVSDVHGLPLQIVGLDDSLDVFPAGSFRFVNETLKPLRIVFGGESTDLAEGSTTVVPSGVGASGGFLPVSIKGESDETFLETRLFCQATGRQIAFIRPPSKAGGRLSITYLSELIAITEGEAD